jgi:PilZ domain
MQQSPLTRFNEDAETTGADHHGHAVPRSRSQRRRSARVPVRLPVNLAVGCDPPVPAMTADISPHGALLLSFIPVPVSTVIWLQNARTKVWVRARVAWHARRRHLGPHQLGIELLRVAPHLWADHDAS